MALPKDELVKGLDDGLARFEELVRSLSDAEWSTPSVCDGWTVGDVARHVSGSMADVVALRLDGLGTPEVTAREVAERAGKTPAEIGDELAEVRKLSNDLAASFDDAAWAAPSPGGFDFTLADGIEALWYDAVLHADDIRRSIDKPAVVDVEGFKASISHIATSLKGHGYPDTTLALDGQPAFDVGTGGDRIEGDPLEFIRAATGRGDPAAFGRDDKLNIYGY